MTDQPGQPATRQSRRQSFVDSLYRYHHALDSGSRGAAEARRVLARLRRSFAGPRQEAEAYDAVFQYDPPEDEQDAWLLLAGLFALHSNNPPRGQERGSLGRPMRELAQTRGASVDPRFRQLLAADRNSLPYYLRQAVRLLHTANAVIDYKRLLDDLVILLGQRSAEEESRRVRLRWAREYHYRPDRTQPTSTAANTSLT